MKPTYLMIKDWVMVKILSQIPNTYVLHTWTANDYSRDLQVKPIPLTTEILEKNGWLNGPYSRLSLQDGKWLEFYWYEHRLQKYWEGIDEWQNHTKQLEIVFKAGCIFYVHELQHALRLCGLNELADNFKV